MTDGDELVVSINLEQFQDLKFGQRIVDGQSPVKSDEWVWNELRAATINDRPNDKEKLNEAFDVIIEEFITNKK